MFQVVTAGHHGADASKWKMTLAPMMTMAPLMTIAPAKPIAPKKPQPTCPFVQPLLQILKCRPRMRGEQSLLAKEQSPEETNAIAASTPVLPLLVQSLPRPQLA